ncbi:protein of unknown function [Flexibacter flexilis DSM 6793]|uniref:YfiR family protein n=1 Tax=Flexibacter flexilis DSM 6793 TaxID=927664 RepID=A0A1I1DD14_9BACT|nr:YfiR family protein [Flexibacter flexilis]SFB70690.1 protein of unknown function [Flexibacter flexilis DSM 6793]
MKKTLVLCILYFWSVFVTFGQAADYKFQSLFLYNIGKLSKWTPEREVGDFKVGVWGDKQIAETMSRALLDKKIGNQDIKVSLFEDASDIAGCHILFVPAMARVSIEKLAPIIEKNNIMLITEHEGWGKKGSIINFVIVNGKMKFEVNPIAAQKANVKLSNSLMAMGILI